MEAANVFRISRFVVAVVEELDPGIAFFEHGSADAEFGIPKFSFHFEAEAAFIKRDGFAHVFDDDCHVIDIAEGEACCHLRESIP